jgi:hypothetical protein
MENQNQIIDTPTSIYDIVKDVRGTSFVGLDTTTPVKVNKTLKNDEGKTIPNPHHGRITKQMIGGGGSVSQNKTVNAYQNKVNKGLVNEGKSPDFVVGPRKWGVRHSELPIVTLRDNVYLELIFQQKGKVQYFLDNQPIEKDDILGFTQPKPSKGQQGGLEELVIIRTFDVTNIDRIRVFGKTYTNITK